MVTTELTQMEKVNRTKRELRKSTLATGAPFLCMTEHLPSNEVIFEYPNGQFEVTMITGVLTPRQFLRLATPSEIQNIRATNPAYGD